MGLPFNGDRLRAYAELGSAELRAAHADRKRRIELRADQRRQEAKTRIEKERVKAQKAKELADLEREMYEARLAAIQARDRAKRARHAAGVFTPAEHMVRVARGATEVSKAFYKGFTKPQPRRRSTRRKSR
jgi:hypothetical protein